MISWVQPAMLTPPIRCMIASSVGRRAGSKAACLGTQAGSCSRRRRYNRNERWLPEEHTYDRADHHQYLCRTSAQTMPKQTLANDGKELVALRPRSRHASTKNTSKETVPAPTNKMMI